MSQCAGNRPRRKTCPAELKVIYFVLMNTKRQALPAFGKKQVEILGRLFDLAREVTADHFRLGEQEILGLPLELRTLASLDKDEIRPAGILADICRYQYQDRTFGRRRDLFRVNIQDHNILTLLKSRGGLRSFSPLLLYVLTHELVHVVRFVKYLAFFHLDEARRPEEERRVHEITQNILRYVPLRGMGAVLDFYQPLARADQGPAEQALRKHFPSGAV